MNPRPFRPVLELEHAIGRGDLRMAVALAKDIAAERERPIGLDVALRLLPLVAVQELDAYDAWACRWLARWLDESRKATIDRAAELAATLAELPVEPDGSVEEIRRSL
jgi:nucleotide-binding universal stress UspA family protein